MGIADWLNEVAEQMVEDERKAARKKHKNNPQKLDRALRRIDARARSAPPAPDLTTMDKAELQTLHDQTEIDIEALNEQLALAKAKRELGRPRQKPGGFWEGATDLVEALGTTAFNEKITAKRKLIAAIKVKLKEPPALPPAPVAPSPYPSKEQKKAADLQAALKEKEQVLASASPEMRPYIERLYREKIDKIMDS